MKEHRTRVLEQFCSANKNFEQNTEQNRTLTLARLKNFCALRPIWSANYIFGLSVFESRCMTHSIEYSVKFKINLELYDVIIKDTWLIIDGYIRDFRIKISSFEIFQKNVKKKKRRNWRLRRKGKRKRNRGTIWSAGCYGEA